VKYQAEVQRLEAALAEAKQNVLQLKAAFEAAESSYAQAVAVRDRAKLNFEKAAALRKSTPGALAGIQVDQAELSLAEANAGVETAQANKEKARLAYKSEIHGESTAVVQLRAQLESARFDLANCEVKAPADGFIPGILLQKGQYLSAGEGVMAFVQANRADLLALIAQNAIRDVKIGQPAEIVLDMYPGRTFSGKVMHILQLTPEGQITANEAIMVALPEGQQTESIVEIALDEGQIDINELTGGMLGQAAIYTDAQKQSHLYRKVSLRMQTWLNYVTK
jgi:multidrug resistance efflux pump